MGYSFLSRGRRHKSLQLRAFFFFWHTAALASSGSSGTNMADNKTNFTEKWVASISEDMSLDALACSQSCSILHGVQFPCGFQIAEVS